MGEGSELNRRLLLILILGLLSGGDQALAQFLESPQPGEIYREFLFVMQGQNWRVTDPDAPYVGEPGNSPEDFLPNKKFPIAVDDLAGAVRVELLIDLWGGHPGTTNKRFRFNNNSWIEIPFPELLRDPEFQAGKPGIHGGEKVGTGLIGRR